MPPKIKLQVNHGKHKKAQKQSGAKLTIQEPVQPPKQAETTKKDKSPEVSKKKKKEDKKLKQETNNKEVESPKKKLKGNKSGKSIQVAQQKQKDADRELATLQRIKEHENHTKKTIEQLLNQYKSAADDIFVNHGHNPEKQKLIQEKLGKLQKEHFNRLDKLKKLEEQAANRKQKKKQKREEKMNNREQRIKQKRRTRAQQKIQQLKALSSQRLQKQAKFQDFYHNDFKARRPLFKKVEEQYREREKQMREENKQKLKNMKKIYQPMDIEEIDEFEDRYNEQKWNMIEENQKRRQEENQLIQKQNMEMKAKLWRGECHRRVQEQQKQKQRIKNEGKSKLEKTKNYGTIVKQSFKPRIDKKNREMSLSISQVTKNRRYLDEEEEENEEYKRVAREKYFQGKNQGLIIEKLKKSLNNEQKNRRGNSYLQYVVNLPKNRTDGSQSARLQQKQPQIPYEPKKLPSTTFKPRRVKNPYYQNASLSEKIPSKGSVSINQNKIKNPQTLKYLVAQMKGKQHEMELQEKSIRYGKYGGILQLQNRHNHLNKKIVQSINDKLDILSKI